MLTTLQALALLRLGLDNLTDHQRTELEIWVFLYSLEQSSKAFDAVTCFDLPVAPSFGKPPGSA